MVDVVPSARPHVEGVGGDVEVENGFLVGPRGGRLDARGAVPGALGVPLVSVEGLPSLGRFGEPLFVRDLVGGHVGAIFLRIACAPLGPGRLRLVNVCGIPGPLLVARTRHAVPRLRIARTDVAGSAGLAGVVGQCAGRKG